MKRLTALILALVMILSLAACGEKKSQAATDADGIIDAIGEVTLDSGATIEAAESAVSALSDEERETLTNLSVLTAAREQYDALVIVNDIDSLGEITLSSGTALEAVRAEYDAASEAVQSGVTNYSALEAAEAQYAQRLSELEDTAKDIISTMRIEEDKVQKMNFYYPAGFPKYIDTRPYVLCYVGTSDTNVWVRNLFDYTGDDWIFWDELTFLIDGEQYYRAYRHNDVHRDNAHGDVWEYMDYTADADDLALMQAIADSTETVVRFEGDDHRYDLTVSQEDKDAINEALLVYAYLKQQQG